MSSDSHPLLNAGLFSPVLHIIYMFQSYGTILFGVTLGFMSLLPLQVWTNATATRQCTNEATTHTLVTVRAFAGTAKYCVHNRDL